MIDFQRSEYSEAWPSWQRIRDITERKNLTQYLRTIRRGNGQADELRNETYQANAIFYAIAGYTYRGMVGTMFRKDPVFDPDPRLEYLTDNADGSGNNIYQLAQATAGDVVRYGRAGLWVDFPPTDGELSRAELGTAFATIQRFEAKDIINWRTTTTGSVTRLSLVVIRTAEERDLGYEVELVDVMRELALDEAGQYFTRKWQKIGSEWVPGEAIYPRNAAGQPLSQIPFTFVGSENNDASVDPAPMLDLVEINIGHYRNSADYEDAVYYAGQTQPWMSGMDEAWLEQANASGFYIGSRLLMPVPAGQTFAFATPDPNPLVRQAMLDKVDQMIGLGARFIQAGGAAKTATEAEGDSMVQHSVLSLIAANVSEAYSLAIQWVAEFMGGEPSRLILEQDFSDLSTSPQMIASWIQSYLQGAIPFSEYAAWMRKRGLFDAEKTDEELQQELESISTI